MDSLDAKQVLSNLYGLMMEINYHQPEEEIIAELQEKPDSQVEKHLVIIKQKLAKLKAHQNNFRFSQAIEQIRMLREKEFEELKNFISPQEQSQLVPLFRKFEELTEIDQVSILEDEELLQ